MNASQGRNRTYADLPGLLRLGTILTLWAIRAAVALFVVFWGAAVIAVTGQALRGMGTPETTDAELAAVGLVLLGATPVVWWWLGRRRLLATPSPDSPLDAELRNRKDALIDLYWRTAKVVAFLLITFVVSVAIAVVVAMTVEGLTGSDPLESDRVMTAILFSGVAVTGILWWWVGQMRQGYGGKAKSPESAAEDTTSEHGPAAPGNAARPTPDIDLPEASVDDWPGAADLDEGEGAD